MLNWLRVLRSNASLTSLTVSSRYVVSVKPSCVRHFDEVRAGDSIRLGDTTFELWFGGFQNIGGAPNKLAWIVGQKVQGAMAPH